MSFQALRHAEYGGPDVRYIPYRAEPPNPCRCSISNHSPATGSVLSPGTPGRGRNREQSRGPSSSTSMSGRTMVARVALHLLRAPGFRTWPAP